MAIARRAQAEQRLQQPMQRGGGEQIAAAHNVGYALERVVDHDGEMIDRRPIFGGDQDVAPKRGLGGDGNRRLAFIIFAPVERGRRFGQRAGEIEPPVRRLAAREPGADFPGRDGDATAAMQRRAVGIALRPDGGDLPARAVAGIDQCATAQRFERGGVVADMFALAARARLAMDAEPVEIFPRGVLVFGSTADGICVFEPQQQPAAEPRRDIGVAQRGIGVPEMQKPVGRGRETEDR